MALPTVRKPLVIDNTTGEPRELASNEAVIDPSPDTFSVTSGEAFAIRDILYQKAADGKWYKADASAIGTMPGLVFALEAASAADESKFVQADSVVTGFTGLTQGTPYFVSTTVAGGYSTTVPSATNNVVQRIGYAISATEMLIDKGPIMVRS